MLFILGTCPQGWVSNFGACYFFGDTSLPWLDAELECQNRGAHLTSIHSAEEETWIRSKSFEKHNALLLSICLGWAKSMIDTPEEKRISG